MDKQENQAMKEWERMQSEIKATQERNVQREAQAAARREAEAKAAAEKAKNFIPNKWIAMKEKMELAMMMWERAYTGREKIFIDPRHMEIQRVMRLRNICPHNADSLIAALERESEPEKYGGREFVLDIFQGLP